MENILELLDKTTKYFEKKGSKSPRLDAEKIFCVALNISRIDIYSNHTRILTDNEKEKIRKLSLNIKKDNNIKKYLDKSIEYLKKYNISEASLITELIFSNILNIDRLLLFTIYNREISDLELSKIRYYLEQVANNVPYQYIINKQNFYGRDFYVDKGVLIPRYDTENLIYNILKIANENINILDIGCGSGVIAITLALEIKGSKVLGIDISDKAIEISNKNIELLNVKNVKILKSDLFSEVKFNKFDIIVSNPPYISNDELDEMSIDTKEYEPYEALFAKNDGLYFYIEIIKKAKEYLNDNGILAFEIGYKQKDSIIKLLEEFKYIDIKSYKDLNNLDRVIIARKG